MDFWTPPRFLIGLWFLSSLGTKTGTHRNLGCPSQHRRHSAELSFLDLDTSLGLQAILKSLVLKLLSSDAPSASNVFGNICALATAFGTPLPCCISFSDTISHTAGHSLCVDPLDKEGACAPLCKGMQFIVFDSGSAHAKGVILCENT